MRKRIFQIVFFALLLSAGIIALTQETDNSIASPQTGTEEAENLEIYDEDFLSELETTKELPEWIKPARWFRSNAGGMAIEELPSQLAALRNKYALVIDFASEEELPVTLLQFFDPQFYIEVRTLFENGREARTQWIFRDKNWTTRVLAVLVDEGRKEADDVEIVEIIESEEEIEEITEIADIEENEEIEEKAIEEIASEETTEYADAETNDESTAIIAVLEDTTEQDTEDLEEKDGYKKITGLKNGFVEVYDEASFLTMEYMFASDGEQDSKIEYFYIKGKIISADSFLWEDNSKGGEFVKTHTDYFRYNRSAFLRSVERVFYKDRKLSFSEETLRIAFPGSIKNAAMEEYIISERLNAYPEFFGDLFAQKNDRLVYNTDDRGKILSQTLYRKQRNEKGEEEDKVVWEIKNVWSGERIVSITKTEDETVLSAVYEYSSGGDRTLERNLKNGVLERLVRTEGNKDIEQLYLNNVVILQAIYEDGRKVSERMMRGN